MGMSSAFASAAFASSHPALYDGTVAPRSSDVSKALLPCDHDSCDVPFSLSVDCILVFIFGLSEPGSSFQVLFDNPAYASPTFQYPNHQSGYLTVNLDRLIHVLVGKEHHRVAASALLRVPTAHFVRSLARLPL